MTVSTTLHTHTQTPPRKPKGWSCGMWDRGFLQKPPPGFDFPLPCYFTGRICFFHPFSFNYTKNQNMTSWEKKDNIKVISSDDGIPNSKVVGPICRETQHPKIKVGWVARVGERWRLRALHTQKARPVGRRVKSIQCSRWSMVHWQLTILWLNKHGTWIPSTWIRFERIRMHQFWVPERPLWKCKLVNVRFFMVSVGYDTLSKTKVLSRRSFLQSLCICSVFGSPGNLVNVSQNMILDIVLERLLHLLHLVVSGHSISETRLGGGCNFFFIFTPILGKWSSLTCAYCSDGLVQPPPKINMTEESQPLDHLKMHFLLKMGSFQLAMLVFRGVTLKSLKQLAAWFCCGGISAQAPVADFNAWELPKTPCDRPGPGCGCWDCWWFRNPAITTLRCIKPL